MQRISPEHISQAAAAVLTTAILWLVFAAPGPSAPPPVNDPGVRLSLEEPPAPVPPQPEPPKPKPRTVPLQHRAVQVVPEPVIVPVDAEPLAPDVPMIAADVPAEPAPAAPSHASVEAAYMAALREDINGRTVVPDTAEYRLLKPHGETLVRFFLDRSGGTPRQVVLQRTSGSRILDAQALHIVSSGRYPPFPEAAFPGEAGQSFLVTVGFLQ